MDGIVLTHGAGSDCNSLLLTCVGQAFEDQGWRVIRRNMAYRTEKPSGPPHPSGAARDRESLRAAVEELKTDRVYLGGHSYGGRQSSMLASENDGLVAGLLLMSYPLHPPRRPMELRTAHLPQLRTPALFIHGSRDPFGSPDELEAARKLIPVRTELSIIQGAGHELLTRRNAPEIAARIAAEFVQFTRS